VQRKWLHQHVLAASDALNEASHLNFTAVCVLLLLWHLPALVPHDSHTC
jgi:hypothetical protein